MTIRGRLVTILCWLYFTLGFVFFHSWRFIGAALFSHDRELAFQRLTNRFFKRFFRLLRTLAPRHRWEIDENIAQIRSSVILCNHLSYLDPILLISLLPLQKTIVKTSFFSVPIFGCFIRSVGYFPADVRGKYGMMMLDQIEEMDSYLAQGGNLFIFPEGTRSRDGRTAPLKPGTLKIVRLCNAPIRILFLRGTENLFTPGRFFFNTEKDNRISLHIIECISADEVQTLSLDQLVERVRVSLEREAANTRPVNRSTNNNHLSAQAEPVQ